MSVRPNRKRWGTWMVLRLMWRCYRRGHRWRRWERRPHRYTRNCRRCWSRQWVFDDGETFGS